MLKIPNTCQYLINILMRVNNPHLSWKEKKKIALKKNPNLVYKFYTLKNVDYFFSLNSY